MKNLLIIIALFLSIESFAQTETDTHVFWHPGVKLTFDMFQGTPSDSAVKIITDHNIFHEQYLGLWGLLDVPKSKKGWKKGMEEKPYICAAMDKKNSFLVVRDSTELKYAQLCFDACEVAARVARQNLAAKVDSAKKDIPGGKLNGVIYIWFHTCLSDGRMFKRVCMDGLNNMIQSRDEESYNEYRKLIDDLLKETEEFATTPEEIQRFITGKPDKGYKLAESMIGDLRKREDLHLDH